MNNSKFSMNALLVVVIIFSAIGLFVTVKLYDMAAHVVVVNQMVPIDGSEASSDYQGYWVRYSTLEPSGIYEGYENTATLRVEGDFGSGWGASVTDDYIYVNKYSYTDVGLTLCDLVRIDRSTYQGETILKNTILRGTCKSGELVCVTGTMLPVNNPGTNSLYDLYAMTSHDVSRNGKATVIFIDPSTAEIVYSTPEEDTGSDSFDSLYIDKTLEEVMP